jgi:hypothetical protein
VFSDNNDTEDEHASDDDLPCVGQLMIADDNQTVDNAVQPGALPAGWVGGMAGPGVVFSLGMRMNYNHE